MYTDYVIVSKETSLGIAGLDILLKFRRRGVFGRIPAFQFGGPGSIPGGVWNFNFYPGTGCVSFVVFCPVLSSVVALTLC